MHKPRPPIRNRSALMRREVEEPRIGLGTGVLLASGVALAGLAVREWLAGKEAERRHPPIGRFLTIDGVRVHYAEWGEGPPVVLLHGNGTMVDDWAVSGLVAAASQHHRVIAIDRPGYGYTERPRSRLWTAKAQADLIRKTLDRLGIDDAVVVGHSWGAIASLALALDHPESVRGLVLLGGYYFPTKRLDVWALSGPAIPVVGDIMRYTASPPLVRLLAPKIIRKLFAPRPVPERFSARFPLGLALRPWQLRASAADSALMIPSVAELQNRYGDLRLPVAILSGSADEIVTPTRQSLRLHGVLPNSTLAVLPGLGHMMHYFAHREILDVIEDVAQRSAALPAQAKAQRVGSSSRAGFVEAARGI